MSIFKVTWPTNLAVNRILAFWILAFWLPSLLSSIIRHDKCHLAQVLLLFYFNQIIKVVLFTATVTINSLITTIVNHLNYD